MTIRKAVVRAIYDARQAATGIAAYERERGLQDGGPNAIVPRADLETIRNITNDHAVYEMVSAMLAGATHE